MDPVLHAFHDELEKTAGSVSALVDRARKATSGGSFAGAHASGEADKGGSFFDTARRAGGSVGDAIGQGAGAVVGAGGKLLGGAGGLAADAVQGVAKNKTARNALLIGGAGLLALKLLGKKI